MNKNIVVILVILIGLGIGFWVYEHGSHKTSVGTADYKNISYEIEGREVKLVNGLSQTEAAPGSVSKIVTRYRQ